MLSYLAPLLNGYPLYQWPAYSGYPPQPLPVGYPPTSMAPPAAQHKQGAGGQGKREEITWHESSARRFQISSLLQVPSVAFILLKYCVCCLVFTTLFSYYGLCNPSFPFSYRLCIVTLDSLLMISLVVFFVYSGHFLLFFCLIPTRFY